MLKTNLLKLVKTSILIIFPVIFLLTGSQLSASADSTDKLPLNQQMILSMKAGDFDKAMNVAEKLIDQQVAARDYKRARHTAQMFANASNPAIARFGLLKLSGVYNAAYKQSGNKNLLVAAGATLVQVSNSAEAKALLALYAKEYNPEQPKSYFSKVEFAAKKMQTDKTLRSAINHIKHGRWELTQSYIEKKLIEVNARHSKDGTSMLHMAVWFNKPEVVRALIEKYNANINIKDAEGDTPLKYAKHMKFHELASYLKSKGAHL